MAYGNDGGLIVIDTVQKTILLSMMTTELYSSADPYTRLPRSPKRPTTTDAFVAANVEDCRPTASDQVNDLVSCFLVFFLVSWPCLFYYAYPRF